MKVNLCEVQGGSMLEEGMGAGTKDVHTRKS